MEHSNSNSTNSPEMPPNHLKRNKLLAVILIPLSLIIISISGVTILGQLLAPPRQVAGKNPLSLRTFHELLGFLGAIIGLVSAVIALTSSLNVGKFFAAGNHNAAAAASEKALTWGKNLPLLTGLLALLVIATIVQRFFIGK